MKSLILALGLLVQAEAPVHYNLVCTGERNYMMSRQKPDPVERIYRIDRQRGAWCEDDCYTAHKIITEPIKPSGGGLVLAAEEDATHEWHVAILSDMSWMEMRDAYKPDTGEHYYSAAITGECRSAPFTPIPDHVFDEPSAMD